MKTTRTTKTKLLLIGLVLFGTSILWGQNCGTPTPKYPRTFSQTFQRGIDTNEKVCINIFFHVVRKDNKSTAFTTPSFNAIIANLNKYFSPHNITFKNAGNDFIDETDYLVIDNEDEGKKLAANFNKTSVINYYIVEKLWEFEKDKYVGGTALTIPSNNVIVNYTQVLKTASPHELGHTLGLYHTFETYFDVKNATSSNCTKTGDLICDTPIDPNKPNNVLNCIYNSYASSNPPLVNNIMSYYSDKCRDRFTEGQVQRMHSILKTAPELNGIQSNSCVAISEIGELCPLQSKNVILTNWDGQTVTWSSSANVNILSSCNGIAKIQATSTSSGSAWIKASLSDNTVLQKNFNVSNPPNNLRITTTGNGATLFTNTWQELIGLGATLGEEIEWKIVSSSVSSQKNGSNSILVYPTSTTPATVSVGVRTKNECGYSDWNYQKFTIKTPSAGTGVAHRGGSSSCTTPLVFDKFSGDFKSNYTTPVSGASSHSIQLIDYNTYVGTVNAHFKEKGLKIVKLSIYSIQTKLAITADGSYKDYGAVDGTVYGPYPKPFVWTGKASDFKAVITPRSPWEQLTVGITFKNNVLSYQRNYHMGYFHIKAIIENSSGGQFEMAIYNGHKPFQL